MATTKTTRKSRNTRFAAFDGTILEQPMATANKAFMASIGLADQVRNGVEEQFSVFGTKFNELAQDGEKVRSRARKSAEKARKEAASSAKTARKNVEKRIETTLESILAMTPVATSDDVSKLNAKLDKVLAKVAG